jgi:hypothetical protein
MYYLGVLWMPSSTPKQARYMKAIAGGMKPRGGGPSRAVAREFMEADMKKPERGDKPKRITTQAPPGGKQTPGAKGTYKPIPEHKTVMKPTPAKMKAYAKGMREHIMNTGSKKKSYSTGGTAGGGSVGGAG